MKKLAVLFVALAAAAWGAEFIAAPPLNATGTVTPAPNGDSTVEIYWDNGTIYTAFAWYTGTNTWGGNDYDISTLSTYVNIASSRIYYYPGWPNGTWEGNGIAAFAFSGGTPGSIMMPSRYVRGSGTVGGWQSYTVGWALPGATRTFLFAYSQLYNYPGVDPVYPLDGNASGGAHSWYYYSGVWARVSSVGYGNRALMHRCTMEDNVDVAPSSFGRVKAMYH